MAERAARFCSWPGCNTLCTERFCDEHITDHERQQTEQVARYNRSRGSAAAQGYDARWQRARLAYLRRHPLCEKCAAAGRTAPATLVHHINPIKDGGARLDIRNLQALCNACHEKIHGPERWVKRKPED